MLKYKPVTKTTVPEEEQMRFINDQEGVTSIEFGVITAVLAIVIIMGVQVLGVSLDQHYSEIADAVKES